MFELVIGEIDIILGRIRGEKEFPEMAYDIWVQSDSDAERKKRFGQLATRCTQIAARNVLCAKNDQNCFIKILF